MARKQKPSLKRKAPAPTASIQTPSSILSAFGNYEPSSSLHIKRPKLEDGTAASSATGGSEFTQVQSVKDDQPIPFGTRRRYISPKEASPLPAATALPTSPAPSPIPIVNSKAIPFRKIPHPIPLHSLGQSQLPSSTTTLPLSDVSLPICDDHPIPFKSRPSVDPPSRLSQPPMISTRPNSSMDSIEPSGLRSPFIFKDLVASLPSRTVQFKSPIIEETPQHIRQQHGQSPAGLVSLEPCESSSSDHPGSISYPPPPIPWFTRPVQEVKIPSSPLTPILSSPIPPPGSIPEPMTGRPPITPPPIATLTEWPCPPLRDLSTTSSEPTNKLGTPDRASPGSTESSPMMPFPPTPGSAASPKWPVSQPRSPSSGSESSDNVDQLASENMEVDETREVVDPQAYESESWRLKYQLMALDLEGMRRKTQGDPRMRRERRANVLQRLLEAEILIGHSVDQMRDCLLKFREDGHTIDSDVVS